MINSGLNKNKLRNEKSLTNENPNNRSIGEVCISNLLVRAPGPNQVVGAFGRSE